MYVLSKDKKNQAACVPPRCLCVVVLRQLRSAADEQWRQPGMYGDKSPLHCRQILAHNRNEFEATAVGTDRSLLAGHNALLL